MTPSNQIQFSDTVNRSSYGPTSTIVAAAGDLILVAIAHAEAAPVSSIVSLTNTGSALAWGRILTVTNAAPNMRLTLYATTPPAAFSGTITVTFPTNIRHCLIAVDIITASGLSVAAPINLMNAKTLAGVGTGANHQLSAFANVANLNYTAVSHGINEAMTPGTGFTELSDFGVTDGTVQTRLQTQWRVNDRGCDPSWATSADYLFCSVEVQVPAVTAPDVQDPYQPVWLVEVATE